MALTDADVQRLFGGAGRAQPEAETGSVSDEAISADLRLQLKWLGDFLSRARVTNAMLADAFGVVVTAVSAYRSGRVKTPIQPLHKALLVWSQEGRISHEHFAEFSSLLRRELQGDPAEVTGSFLARTLNEIEANMQRRIRKGKDPFKSAIRALREARGAFRAWSVEGVGPDLLGTSGWEDWEIDFTIFMDWTEYLTHQLELAIRPEFFCKDCGTQTALSAEWQSAQQHFFREVRDTLHVAKHFLRSWGGNCDCECASCQS